MDATQAAVDRAIGDCTTEMDSDSDQPTDLQNVSPDSDRFAVDADDEAIEPLELPEDWTETDLTDESVEIDGIDNAAEIEEVDLE
ncbi:hypothetical protein [Natronorubrum sp. FCH18a]|uniref:hypothetical protein n=1 Tax=Natronorubrum sp. FCH18a TaxID=3447018 RepID=UPI003F51A7E3